MYYINININSIIILIFIIILIILLHLGWSHRVKLVKTVSAAKKNWGEFCILTAVRERLWWFFLFWHFLTIFYYFDNFWTIFDIFLYCKTQPPASIGWVALSSVIGCSSSSRIRDTSSHLHHMMFPSIQTIYFLYGYDPGNESVSKCLLMLSWAQFTVV